METATAPLIYARNIEPLLNFQFLARARFFATEPRFSLHRPPFDRPVLRLHFLWPTSNGTFNRIFDTIIVQAADERNDAETE